MKIRDVFKIMRIAYYMRRKSRKLIIRGETYQCNACEGYLWVPMAGEDSFFSTSSHNYMCICCANEIRLSSYATSGVYRCQYEAFEEQQRKLNENGPADYF